MNDASHDPYTPPPFPPGRNAESGALVPLKNPTVHCWFAIVSIAVTTISVVGIYVVNVVLKLGTSPSHPAGDSSFSPILDSAGWAFVVTIVSVCMWTYRSASNARRLPGGYVNSAPGWCVGSYFVPIVSLFVPYLCMREIAESTFRYSTRPGVKPLLLPWWLCWLGFQFLGKGTRFDIWNITALVCLIVAAVVLSLIIHRITKAQVALSTTRLEEIQVPPPQAQGAQPSRTTLPGYQKSPR